MYLDSATNTIVQNNFIGTKANGMSELPNEGNGVVVSSSTNVQIGGANTVGNVISGNGKSEHTEGDPNKANGVMIISSDLTRIQGNHIGTDVTGTKAVPNHGDGISVNTGSSTLVGGEVAEGNRIAGNKRAGVSGKATEINNNKIGIKQDGAALPNMGGGIILNGNGATVSQNEIGYNGGPGIAVLSGTGHSITQNSIHDNDGAGIRVLAGSDNLASLNTITSNAEGGIHLPEGSTADTFQISQNTLDSLLIEDGSVEVVGLSPVTQVTLSGGNLTGANVLEVLDSMSWTGGSLTGSGRIDIKSTATLTLSGSQTLALQRLLHNYGSADWTGSGRLTIDEDAAFVNKASAVFDAQGTGTLGSDNGTGTFTNFGTYVQSGVMGTPSFTDLLTFTNSGSVQVFPAARLNIPGTYEQTAGSTYLDTGSTMEVTTPLHYTAGWFGMLDATLIATEGFHIGSAVTFSGTGSILGDVVSEGAWTLGDYYESPATLTIDGNVTLDGSTFHLRSGELGITGNVTNNDAILEVSGGVPLHIDGDFQQTGGITMLHGPSNYQATFTVGGSLTLSGGTFTLGMSAWMAVDGSVTLSDGLLTLETGEAQLTAGSGLSIGVNGQLAGVGAIVGNVTNAGILRSSLWPVAGLLSIQGNYTQSSTGTLHATIDEFGGGDQFQVSGQATLDGAFVLTLQPNGSPYSGPYAVLSSSSRSGTFASLSLPDLGSGYYWDWSYASGLSLWVEFDM